MNIETISSKTKAKLLSLVVPVYYEEECINEFIKRTTETLDKLGQNYEIVFIDDGSTDRTVELIKEEIQSNDKIKLIEFSYNHGKQSAVSAGIKHARGDYLLYMDPDLQDPPQEIPRFLAKAQEGYDLVFGVREEKEDSLINKLSSKLFWFLLRKMTGLQLPESLAVMRIFNRRFADQFLRYSETNRFIEGIFMDISMNWTKITIENHKRFAGRSKFTFFKKLKLAINAMFDFSDIPLKLAAMIGIFLMLIGLIAALGILIMKFFYIDFQIGWPSLMIMLMIGFGLQLFFMGIIGKYVGNIYKESKNRPLYSIKALNNFHD